MVWTCAEEGEWISWTKGGEDGAAGRKKRNTTEGWLEGGGCWDGG